MVLLIVTQILRKKHPNGPNEPVKCFYWMQKLQSICNTSPATAPYWFSPAVTFLFWLLLLFGSGALGGGNSGGGRGCRRWRGGRGWNALVHCITRWHGHTHCRREPKWSSIGYPDMTIANSKLLQSIKTGKGKLGNLSNYWSLKIRL